MTLALELAGAFIGGIGCTVTALGVFGPRFARWYMKRAMRGMLPIATAAKTDPLLEQARASRAARLGKKP